MAKRKRRRETKNKFEYWPMIIGLVLIVVSLLSMISPIQNMGFVGQLGASFAMFLIGTGYEILLLAVFILGLYLVVKREWPDFLNTHFIGLYIIAIGFIVLAHAGYIEKNSSDIFKVFEETIDNLLANFSNSLNNNPLTLQGAGIIGAAFGVAFYKLFSLQGSYIVSIILIMLGTLFLTGIDLFAIIAKPFKRKKKEKKLSLEDTGVIVNDSTVIKEALHEMESNDNKIKIHSINEVTHQADNKAPEEDINSMIEQPDNTNQNYKLPDLSILSRTNGSKNKTNEAVIEANIEKLERVLKDFGIISKVVEVNVGPSVTQYELDMPSGTKVSKITGLSKEISLALAKKDVRIQAPIPGKSTVGIELANDQTTPVGLREILEDFKNLPAKKQENKLMVA